MVGMAGEGVGLGTLKGDWWEAIKLERMEENVRFGKTCMAGLKAESFGLVMVVSVKLDRHRV